MAATRMSLRKVLRKDAEANGVRAKGLLRLAIGILMSPSASVLACYRLSEHLRRFPIAGRVLSKLLWRMSINGGCHISSGAVIGPGLSMPHPVGIVIGSGSIIEEHVTIYQGVTLGVNGRSMSYPTLQSGATVYAGAVILGGVNIGKNAIVGANAVVTRDVPEGSVAVGVPARIVSSTE